MCVDACISGGASKVLVFSVRDVLMCAGITVFLGEAKVYDVDQVAFLSQAHEEVVRFDISVDEVLGMDVLNSTDLGWTGGRASNRLLEITREYRRMVESLQHGGGHFTGKIFKKIGKVLQFAET